MSAENAKWKFKAKIIADSFGYQSEWCKGYIPLDKKVGDWVEGYHIEQLERHYIIPSNKITGEGHTGGEVYFKYWYRVDPKTVEPIFEEDIDISSFSPNSQKLILSTLKKGKDLLEEIKKYREQYLK